MKKGLYSFTTALLILSLLVSCSDNKDNLQNAINNEPKDQTENVAPVEAGNSITLPDSGLIDSSNDNDSNNASTKEDSSTSTAPDISANENATNTIISAADYSAIEVDFKKKDLNADYSAENCVSISFSDNLVSINGSGAVQANEADLTSLKKPYNITSSNAVVITQAGDYLISGSCEDGQIIIAADSEDDVRLILNNANIACQDSAPIVELSCDKLIITLAEGSTNTLKDGSTDTPEDSSETASNIEEAYTITDAAIYAKDSVTINGTGQLNITSDNGMGIHSKDTIKLVSGDINIISGSHGIKGKDSVVISSANIDITSKADGIKSTNTNEGKGNVVILGGNTTINTTQDGISAVGKVEISDGELTIKSTGAAIKNSEISTKGIKSAGTIFISGGNINIETTDDSIHSNTDILIADGTITISSGDDGIHADSSITINGGSIKILKSYEGIESEVIYINDGDIMVYSNDDGINASSPSAGNSIDNFGGKGNIGDRIKPDMPEGEFGGDAFNFKGGQRYNPENSTPDFSNDGFNPEEFIPDNFGGNFDSNGDFQNIDHGGKGGFGGVSSNATLHINGGNVYVNSAGDGLDSNGTLYVTGGVILVDGPTNSGNSAIDHDGTALISGGVLVGSGSSGMIELFDESSTQNVLMVYFNKTLDANSEIKITNGDDLILSYKNAKASQCAMISSPKLLTGETYTVSINDEKLCDLTIASTITSNGSTQGFGGFGGFGGKGDRGNKGNRFQTTPGNQ